MNVKRWTGGQNPISPVQSTASITNGQQPLKSATISSNQDTINFPFSLSRSIYSNMPWIIKSNHHRGLEQNLRKAAIYTRILSSNSTDYGIVTPGLVENLRKMNQDNLCQLKEDLEKEI
ncbi:hypothetical protein V2J09_019518 [Rumex salicifolius]